MQWNYAWIESKDAKTEIYFNSELKEILPEEIINIGTIHLSKFIHENAFSAINDFYTDSRYKKTFAQAHTEIKELLRTHLNKMNRIIFER